LTRLVRLIQAINAGTKVERLTVDLMKYLKEGVLQDDFILDNIPRLMGLMRDANVTLRWTMLHCAVLHPGETMLHAVLHPGETQCFQEKQLY
jgi:Hereditary spastic paraplegia protein strumpellin